MAENEVLQAGMERLEVSPTPSPRSGARTPSTVREARFSQLRQGSSVDVCWMCMINLWEQLTSTRSIDERRMLVNRLLNLLFTEEMQQFFEDGVYNRPNSLLNAVYTKFLEFPPVQKDKKGFETALNDIMTDLPDLIQAYSKATGKDAGKKLRQVTVGNLTLSLVPDELSGDLGEDMDAVLARLESDDIDPSTEHNYYQRQLLSLFTLFIAGLEQDGGTAAFANRIRAYHSLEELPQMYQKVFDGLRKFMLHSMMKMGGNKKRLDTLKRVYRVTPQSAITAVLRLGSGTKVMTGFAGLLLQKIGSYTLLQRLLYSRLDIDAIEAQRDQCVQHVNNDAACRTLLAYIEERYPIAQGWQAFDKQLKMQNVLKAQIAGSYEGEHARATETTQRKRSVLARAGDKIKFSVPKKERKSDSKLSVADEPSIKGADSIADPPSTPSRSPSASRSPSIASVRASLMTQDDIMALTDQQCGALFGVAERELARQDMVALVDFAGSKTFVNFIDRFLTSLAGPLSEATHGGGMGDVAQSMFKIMEKAIEVHSSDYPVEKKRMLLDQQLQIFMADVYRFFQAAVTHDRGQFMETLEWALESYSNANGGLDLDYLLSGLADDEQTALWNEVNHYLYWMKYKKFLPPEQAPKPTHISKLVPRMKRLLSDYFAPVQSDTRLAERAESMDALTRVSALLASHIPSSGDSKIQVVTHIVVSFLEHTNFVLEKQGFRVVEQLSRGSIGGDNVWVLMKLSGLSTDGIGPIVGIDIASSDKESKKLELGGYIKMSSNLNKGALFRSAVNLWYKRGDPKLNVADAIDDIIVVYGDGKPAMPGTYSMIAASPNKSSYTGKSCRIWYRRVRDGPQKDLL